MIYGTVRDRAGLGSYVIGSQASYTRSHTHYCMSKRHTPLHGQMSYAITSLVPRLSPQKREEERAWERGYTITWSNIKYSPQLQLVVGICLVHVQGHCGQAADFHNFWKLVLVQNRPKMIL